MCDFMLSSMMPDTATARALLRENGIIVGEEHILPVPEGTINTTFRILRGQEPPLYLRIAPGDAEVEASPGWMTAHGLRREMTVIGMLEPLEHLLPRMVHADWSRELIDRDWVLQTQVPGIPWPELRPELTVDEDRDLWRQLGEITRTIHAVRGAEFGPPEEGYGHGRWSELVRWDVTGFQVDAHRFGIESDAFQRLTMLVNGSVDDLDEVTEPRLVHSDLHDRHVFVRRDDRGAPVISGLIDLEFARFADPYSESIFVMQGLSEGDGEEFAAFCDGYGCEPPARGSEHRSLIYQLTALGWIVMDLHRRGDDERIPEVLERMVVKLDEAERNVHL
jgi:aminoglycoside phosphotransferase (APT) family kinase protein